MKRSITSIIILTLISALILSLTACSASAPIQIENSIYDFEKYESDEVFDIEKVETDAKTERTCVTYQFRFLSDSYKIKAYISIPVSAIKSGEQSKCVLFCRGGNCNKGTLDESWTASICKACDRVAVAAEYRGTEGMQGDDQFGGNELNDVIKLIDLCENNFSFVDMDDFCVAGVSRGGMMTYMSARRDSRIKRIISVSGVCDLFRAYEERDDMKEVLKKRIGYTPQEQPEEYEKRSAVYWADEIGIPVLMIHSKLDEQVSYKQAEELYEKLKDTTDCTFITHDDDVHGLHPEDLKTINEWLN